jgi:DNA-binding NarL/FixJ family response regulator
VTLNAQIAETVSVAGGCLAAPIKVGPGDDSAWMRRCMHATLEHEDDIDVLVLAARLPDRSHIETVSTAHEQAPRIEIVFATTDDNPTSAEAALQAGAIGFVRKDRADIELAQQVTGHLQARARR